MIGKRVTIYDLAKELGISASYVSRALNNHPSISKKVREAVTKKATQLNYKPDSRAANLRKGSSKTLGVIVPKINESFFSEAIAGIEEVCFENHHSLMICQSHESYQQENLALDTLIHHNVDCILISISAETKTSAHLKEVTGHNIHLIQFDRYLDDVDSYKVVNDNKEATYNAVKNLINEGYKKIAFLGGPGHLLAFKNRKKGYVEAIKEAGLNTPFHYINDEAFSKEKAVTAALELLRLKDRPDAFFCVSDLQALGVLEAAHLLKIKVPQEVGIFGFANESFTPLIKPALSSIDQKSKEMGKCAANLYFENIMPGKSLDKGKKKVIRSEIIQRQSSSRKH